MECGQIQRVTRQYVYQPTDSGTDLQLSVGTQDYVVISIDYSTLHAVTFLDKKVTSASK
jgi:hypothetical protein